MPQSIEIYTNLGRAGKLDRLDRIGSVEVHSGIILAMLEAIAPYAAPYNQSQSVSIKSMAASIVHPEQHDATLRDFKLNRPGGKPFSHMLIGSIHTTRFVVAAKIIPALPHTPPTAFTSALASLTQKQLQIKLAEWKRLGLLPERIVQEIVEHSQG